MTRTRKILSALFATGAVVGFSSGFAHMHHEHHHRRARFEAHVARVCVSAAQDVLGPPADRPHGHHAAPPELRRHRAHRHHPDRARVAEPRRVPDTVQYLDDHPDSIDLEADRPAHP